MILMKRKNKWGLPLMAVGGLLMVTALVMLVFDIYKDIYAGKVSAAVEQELRTQIQENTEERDSSTQEDSTETPLYVKNPEMSMPVISMEDNDYIGILEIPDLEMSLPVMSGWSYSKLKVSPCRYYGTAYMNNMVIAAHNYDSQFGRLDELEPGTSVAFTDVSGNLFCYEVIETEDLEASSVDEMKNSDYDLTLFTCAYGGKKRYTVRCSLIATFPAK
jgi:sortase A